MKYIFIILAEFLILVDSRKKDLNFRPNLPLGNYRVNVIAYIPCNVNSTIQYNLFLYKTSRNTTDLRGNVTSVVPFDDSLVVRVTMDIKDKIGNWQSNAYVYKSPKAYTNVESLLGAEFHKFLYSFGMIDTIHKVIPPGIYISKGYDISNYPENTNFPRQVFYGTYKLNINYEEKNGVPCACAIFVVEIKRPWEIE